MLKELTNIEAVKELINSENKIVIYKHSTRCNVSYDALQEVQSYLEKTSDDIYVNNVIEHRDVSNFIEAESGIRHESPQIIVFENGKVIFTTSHFRITEAMLTEELA